MRGVTMLLAAMFSVAALTGCSQTWIGGEWAGMTHPAVLAKADLKYYWHSSAPMLPGECVRTISRLDENVYLLMSSNRLVAMDAMTGVYKWSYKLAAPDDIVFFPPVHVENVVLTPGVSGIKEILKPSTIPPQKPFNAVMLNTLTQVTVINRATGQAVRAPGDIPTSGKFVGHCAGTANGVDYFMGSPDGQFHAINLQDGLPVWTRATSNGLDPISVPLVLSGNHLYAGNEAGGFYCTYLSQKGTAEWSAQLEGGILGGFYVDERGCFIPCTDHRIYAFNPVTGVKLWNPFICDGQLRQAIQVGENSIFQFADRDKFYCLDVATGRLRWPAIADGRLVLGDIDGNVYVRSDCNNLLVIDEMLGSRKFSLPLTGHQLFTGNTTAPAIYTARYDGRVYCITPSTLIHLTPEMLKSKRAAQAPAPIIGNGTSASAPTTEVAPAPLPPPPTSEVAPAPLPPPPAGEAPATTPGK